MRKLFLSCFMFVILIFSFGSMAMAANSEAFSLTVNRVKINDQKPFIINQRQWCQLGPAWEVWEGKIKDQANLTNQTNDKEVIPNLVHAVNKEGVKCPSYSGTYIFFTDEWMYSKES